MREVISPWWGRDDPARENASGRAGAMGDIISVLRRRWAASAWLDTFLKDAVLVAVFALLDLLAWLVLFGPGDRTWRSHGMLGAALYGALSWGTGTAVFLLIFRTIRAALSGRFLDEYRAKASAGR